MRGDRILRQVPPLRQPGPDGPGVGLRLNTLLRDHLEGVAGPDLRAIGADLLTELLALRLADIPDDRPSGLVGSVGHEGVVVGRLVGDFLDRPAVGSNLAYGVGALQPVALYLRPELVNACADCPAHSGLPQRLSAGYSEHDRRGQPVLVGDGALDSLLVAGGEIARHLRCERGCLLRDLLGRGDDLLPGILVHPRNTDVVCARARGPSAGQADVRGHPDRCRDQARNSPERGRRNLAGMVNDRVSRPGERGGYLRRILSLDGSVDTGSAEAGTG